MLVEASGTFSALTGQVFLSDGAGGLAGVHGNFRIEGGAIGATCGCRKLKATPQATIYSWIRPPSRSRRRMWVDFATVVSCGRSQSCVARCSRLRWGRCGLK